jgi:hypothetical protein
MVKVVIWARRNRSIRQRLTAHAAAQNKLDSLLAVDRLAERRRLNVVHQCRAVRPIDAAVVPLHHPVVLLICAGGDLHAVPCICVSPFSVLAHNSSGQKEKPDERKRPKNPPDEFDDDRDDYQQRKQRAEPARIARPARATPCSPIALDATCELRQVALAKERGASLHSQRRAGAELTQPPRLNREYPSDSGLVMTSPK